MQITSHYKVSGDRIVRLYGITQDPETKNYTTPQFFDILINVIIYLGVNPSICYIGLFT